MDAKLSEAASLSDDAEFVKFSAKWRDRTIDCAISRKALEIWFWAPSGADPQRLVKAYNQGRKSIAVVVERRLLRQAVEPIVLTHDHFSK